jgi:hypothetical protein
MYKARFICRRCENPQVLVAELGADSKRYVRKLQVHGSIRTARSSIWHERGTDSELGA